MKPNTITLQVQITNDARGIGVKTTVADAPSHPVEAMTLAFIRGAINDALQAVDGFMQGTGAAKGPMKSFDGAAADVAEQILQPKPVPAAPEQGKN